MRKTIVLVTVALLLFALAASVIQLWAEPGFGPAASALTVTAAILGWFIDRWLSERERRRQLLRALVHELYMKLGVLRELDDFASSSRFAPCAASQLIRKTLGGFTYG